MGYSHTFSRLDVGYPLSKSELVTFLSRFRYGKPLDDLKRNLRPTNPWGADPGARKCS